MGAATSILIGGLGTVKNLHGMVLDSPFSDAKTMIADLMNHQAGFPKFLIKAALLPIGSTIKSKTGHAALDVSPIDVVSLVDVPAYYMVASGDFIARPERVKELFENHKHSRKELLEMVGEHNDFRSDFDIKKAIDFINVEWEKVFEIKVKS